MSNRRLYPQIPQVGVGILIQDEDKYLLIKRAAEPDAGLWTIPGGIVELGETAKDAAVREVYEETGLEIVILDLLDVVDKIITDDSNRIKYHFIIVDYLAKVYGGQLNPSSDATDARWVAVSDISKYQLSPTLLKLLKEKGLY
jgi:ADP-ribose pyrophosphatase